MIRELEPQEVPKGVNIAPGSLLMGVVEDGKVVAVLGAFTAVMLDPLWVDESRRNGLRGTLRELWSATRDRLKLAGIKAVFGHADTRMPGMAHILKRIGGVEITGKRQFVVFLGE